MTVDVNLF